MIRRSGTNVLLPDPLMRTPLKRPTTNVSSSNAATQFLFRTRRKMTRKTSSWTHNPNGHPKVLILLAFGYLLVSSLVMTSWLLSAVSNRHFVTEWCSTSECQERLQALRTKLELEEQLYQEQRLDTTDVEVVSFRRADILRERLFQMFQGDGVESKPQYRPKPEWRGSFPSLNVVGQIKTGTSQLYNLFNTHAQVASIPEDEKEHCAKDHKEVDLYEYQMFQWHDYYYRHRSSSQPHQVNGCLILSDLERRYAYNPPSPSAKFFYLLRDPADWAWAAYNFFCDESSEEFEPDDNWVNASIHYRSPEAFHELVLSGGKLKGSELLTNLRDQSVWTLRRLRALVGEENLIVLRNEDLQPHRIQETVDGRGSTLDYIVQRTGLSLEGFDQTVLTSRSNCNANKGYAEKCRDQDRSKGVGYPVTSGRTMLESTRKFIYVQWHETCKIWKEEFGVTYDGCLSSE